LEAENRELRRSLVSPNVGEATEVTVQMQEAGHAAYENGGTWADVYRAMQKASTHQPAAAMTNPNAGHPLLQALVDSVEIVSGVACWSYSAMYDVRDALLASQPSAPAAPLPSDEQIAAWLQKVADKAGVISVAAVIDIASGYVDSGSKSTLLGDQLQRILKHFDALPLTTGTNAGKASEPAVAAIEAVHDRLVNALQFARMELLAMGAYTKNPAVIAIDTALASTPAIPPEK
jgi:hypothetical protein